MPGMCASMEEKIKAALESEDVVVRDTSTDNSRVEIIATSDAFEGKNMVQRQRLVYKAIWEELSTTLHAVDRMVVQTPAERDAGENMEA